LGAPVTRSSRTPAGRPNGTRNQPRTGIKSDSLSRGNVNSKRDQLILPARGGWRHAGRSTRRRAAHTSRWPPTPPSDSRGLGAGCVSRRAVRRSVRDIRCLPPGFFPFLHSPRSGVGTLSKRRVFASWHGAFETKIDSVGPAADRATQQGDQMRGCAGE